MGKRFNKSLAKILFLLLTGFGSFAPVFAQPFAIGNTDLVWNDPDRANRAVTLHVYYPAQTAGTGVPAATGNFPAVVFGHGFAMGYGSYQNLWTQFVPRGYIFLMVDMETGLSPNHDAFARDLLFAGKQFRQTCQQDASFILYQKHNSKTGIAGHSMGGGAAVLAASYDPAFADALWLMAPAETNPSAVAAAPAVTVAVVLFSGSADAVTPPQQHHLPIYQALGSSCKRFVSLLGGAHCYFANADVACDFGETVSGTQATINRQQQQALVTSIANPFLDVYLRADAGQQTALDAALTQPGITVTDNCVSGLGILVVTQQQVMAFPNPCRTSLMLPGLPAHINTVKLVAADGKTYTFPIFGQKVELLELPAGLYVWAAGAYHGKVLVQNAP